MNADDNAEAFTFTGNFGANPQVAVSFINDAYGGSSSLDRNLYLDGCTYDGVEQLNDKAPLPTDQTVTYTLTSTQPTAVRTADFQDSIGVNTHLSYLDTTYGLADGSAPNTALP